MSTRAGTGSVTMLASAERAPGLPNRANGPVARCDEGARPGWTRSSGLQLISTVGCEYVALPRSAFTCVVCRYLRVEGSCSDAVPGSLAERLPVELGVEVELNDLDRTICCELANHGEPGEKRSGHHQDSVVVTLGDQTRQVIEFDCEAIDDPNQLKHLEIVRRRFAIRSALGSQLAVEVLEEPRRRTNDASGRTHFWFEADSV